MALELPSEPLIGLADMPSLVEAVECATLAIATDTAIAPKRLHMERAGNACGTESSRQRTYTRLWS